MGVFCGQNFELEYIDVLLNKLLLCVIILIIYSTKFKVFDWSIMSS